MPFRNDVIKEELLCKKFLTREVEKDGKFKRQNNRFTIPFGIEVLSLKKEDIYGSKK